MKGKQKSLRQLAKEFRVVHNVMSMNYLYEILILIETSEDRNNSELENKLAVTLPSKQ